MKNFEFIFKNGQMHDIVTGKEIYLKPNARYTIQSDNENFLHADFLSQSLPVLKADEKITALQRKYKQFDFMKLGSAGDTYYFLVGLGRKTEEDLGHQYLFEAQIEEDLYMKAKKDGKWNLCECVSTATQLVDGELGFPFEPIQATSLSALFAKVVSTYFNKKRSTACNAFTTFHVAPKNESPNFQWIKRNNINLDLLRKAVILKQKLEDKLID
jgi:hypothetical protein